MTIYLEVAYMAPYAWCHLLLKAVSDNPRLVERHKKWRSHRLSDLAFAIEGRRHGLHHLVRFVDERLNILGRALERDPKIARCITEGAAHVFSTDEEIAVQQVLVGITSFVREARTCFENLADFQAEFLTHYVGMQPGDKRARYEALDRVLGDPKWVDELHVLRHDLSHYRYPWLAFRVRKRPSGRYDPVLVLNWRPEASGPTDRVQLQTLKRIRSGLDTAIRRVVTVLARRARRAR